MTFGVTATGFNRKKPADILDEITTLIHTRISKHLRTRDPRTFIGNLCNIFADQAGEIWEALEAVYNANDPDNSDATAKIANAALFGLQRSPGTKGRVAQDVILEASQAFAIGELVVHDSADPENRWSNAEAVSSVGQGGYNVLFESEKVGASANAGTLTVIAEPISGFLSTVNHQDATPGTDLETPDALEIRRQGSVAKPGSSSVPGIRADLLEVDGITTVRVFENTADTIQRGMVPHSVRLVVWDGETPAALNADIAAALYASKSAGVQTNGLVSVTLQDGNGEDEIVKFDRASQLTPVVVIEVVAPTGTTEQAVKDALLSGWVDTPGEPLYWERLKCKAFAVPGLTKIPVFTIDGAGNDIVPDLDEIVLLRDANITVTVSN